MADYRELLRRAIDALPENNGTARRAVYEKARSALVTQLHAIEPPIPARDITQHRLTLEDCIRQVEQEATEKLLQGLSRRDEPEPVAPMVTAPDEVAVEPQFDAQIETPDAEDLIEAEADMVPESEAFATDSIESKDDSFEQAPIEEVVTADEPAELGKTDQSQSIESEPLEDKIEVVEDNASNLKPLDGVALENEPETADDATPEVSDDDDRNEGEFALNDDGAADDEDASDEDDASRHLVAQLEELSDDDTNEYGANSVDDVIAQARAATGLNVPPPLIARAETDPAKDNVEAALSSVREVDFDPEELSDSDEEAQAAIDRALLALDREAEGEHAPKADDVNLDDFSDEVDIDSELLEESEDFIEDEQAGSGGGLLVFLGVFVLLIGLLGGGTYWAWREGYVNLDLVLAQVGLGDLISSPANVDEGKKSQPTDGNNTQTPMQTNVRDVTPANSGNSTADAGGEVPRLTPENPTNNAAGDNGSTGNNSTADTSPAGPANTDTNSTDDTRLPSEDVGATTQGTPETPLNVQDPTAQASAGSQSLLIEEQTSGSGGAVPFSGQTQWTREVDELGIPTIRATASIPARNLSVDVLIRKNSDEALPASHLIEVNFTVTDSFLGGSIASLPGVLMKDQELAQGTPLIGASVRIVDNSFLFAMSGAEADMARNLELIGQNGWLDLPLVYGTGRKAILTLEKGVAGNQIFEDVLAEWASN